MTLPAGCLCLCRPRRCWWPWPRGGAGRAEGWLAVCPLASGWGRSSPLTFGSLVTCRAPCGLFLVSQLHLSPREPWWTSGTFPWPMLHLPLSLPRCGHVHPSITLHSCSSLLAWWGACPGNLNGAVGHMAGRQFHVCQDECFPNICAFCPSGSRGSINDSKAEVLWVTLGLGHGRRWRSTCSGPLELGRSLACFPAQPHHTGSQCHPPMHPEEKD